MVKTEHSNIIKYIIILGIIYSLLKLVPEQNIEDKDLLLILVVVVFTFYVVDVILNKDIDVDVENFLGDIMNNQIVEEKTMQSLPDQPKPQPQQTIQQLSQILVQLLSQLPLQPAMQQSALQIVLQMNTITSANRNSFPNNVAIPLIDQLATILSLKTIQPHNQSIARDISKQLSNIINTNSQPQPQQVSVQDYKKSLDFAQQLSQIVSLQPIQPTTQQLAQQLVQQLSAQKFPNQTVLLLQQLTQLLVLSPIQAETQKLIQQLSQQLVQQVSQIITTITPKESPINNTPKISSGSAVIVKKYFNSLLAELLDSGIITDDDVNNINMKVESKLVDIDEVISTLENLKLTGKKKPKKPLSNDSIYNELDEDLSKPIGGNISNKWESQYSILNTNKWKVPMARPPVCVNTTPCQVCPTTESGYVDLASWDTSRVLSSTNINKNWADSQNNSAKKK
jgi:hypothetical protein